MSNILLMLGVLGVLIVAHEFGHFLFAKIFGVGVRVFSVGFGKILLKKKIGETEYALSAIPLGGYVKMEGEEAGDASSLHPEKMFSKKPIWQRTLIVLAGPFFNFLLAFFIFLGIALWYGIPVTTPHIGGVISGLPAAEVGLRAGDTITGVWAEETFYVVSSFEELSSLIARRAGKPTRFFVRRTENGAEREFEISITPIMRGGRGIIGIESAVPKRFDRMPGRVFPWAASQTGRIITETAGAVWGMINGSVSLQNISGPLGIVQIGGQAKAEAGLTGVLFLAALLSVNLGILNLLPIPILDGGHLPLFLWEAIRRKPLSKTIETRIKIAGLVFLLFLMFLGFFFDISRLLG